MGLSRCLGLDFLRLFSAHRKSLLSFGSGLGAG